LRILLPEAKGVLVGKLAFGSVDASETTSEIEETRFQYGSAALTVTFKAVPAICGCGMPLLPLGVSGAEVSPGSRSCNLVNAAGLTAILVDVIGARSEVVKVMEIFVATLWARFVKLTRPFSAVSVDAPCKAP